ncbi:hypothetical protein KCU60_g51, partial [Aureobasidium melanogenum]
MWLRSAQRCQMVGDWTREARYFFGRSTCRCALLQVHGKRSAQVGKESRMGTWDTLSNSRWMDEGEQRGEREEEKQKGKA